MDEERSVLDYGCDDLVVVGRVNTIGYSDATTEDDIIGRGVFIVEVRIKRVLYGKERNTVVKASLVSHAEMRRDRDFVFVLSPSDDGYTIETAQLRDYRPKIRLVDICE